MARERRAPDAKTVAGLRDLANPAEPDPLGKVEKDRIPELVEGLPAGSRAVLILHYVDDLPVSEVAEVLGLPQGTAKSRLSYGLGVLRRQLEAEN